MRLSSWGFRFRDRRRREERQDTFKSIEKVKNIMNGYIKARKGETESRTTVVLWGRLLVAILVPFLVFFLILLF